MEFTLVMPAYGDVVEEDFFETSEFIVWPEQIEGEICSNFGLDM